MPATRNEQKVYTIYEEPTHAQHLRGVEFGRTITDAYSRADAIDTAEGYFQDRSEEAGEFGKQYRDMVLGSYDPITDEETFEKVRLTWEAEPYTGDSSRLDYLAGIGAARSF